MLVFVGSNPTGRSMRKNQRIIVNIEEASVNGVTYVGLRVEGDKSDVFGVLHLMLTQVKDSMWGADTTSSETVEVRDADKQFVPGGVIPKPKVHIDPVPK